MKRWIFYTIVIFLIIVILSAAAYNARTVREYASTSDESSSSAPKTPKLQYYPALELNAILQDTTLSSSTEKINLIKQLNIPEESLYGKVLTSVGNSAATSGNAAATSGNAAPSSMSNADNQISQLQDLLNKNMHSGQLASRIIAEDQKIDSKQKVQMIKKFGSPPPIYPKIFNGSNTTDNEIALVQTKGF